MWSLDLKFYHLTKINGKAENYAISAQQQLELELPFLLGSDGESELNGKKSVRPSQQNVSLPIALPLVKVGRSVGQKKKTKQNKTKE